MERLTKDDVKQMGMVDLSHNQAFVRNREAWCRDFETEITARDLARAMFARNGIECPADIEEFDEYMLELLQDGYETTDGMIAMLYNVLWSMAEIRERLKAYEDTGLEPEDVEDLKDCVEGEEGTQGTVRDLLELMEYRKLEKQGRLIKLPCKVGDTIYFIKSFEDRIIKKATIENIHIWSSEHIKIESHTDKSSKYWTGQEWNIKDFGKRVFLTEEEAEKALEEK